MPPHAPKAGQLPAGALAKSAKLCFQHLRKAQRTPDKLVTDKLIRLNPQGCAHMISTRLLEGRRSYQNRHFTRATRSGNSPRELGNYLIFMVRDRVRTARAGRVRTRSKNGHEQTQA
jgi:hypothetical protein